MIIHEVVIAVKDKLGIPRAMSTAAVTQEEMESPDFAERILMPAFAACQAEAEELPEL